MENYKTRFKEAMTEVKLIITFKEIKKTIWGYVMEDFPKFEGHLKFYLEFDILHKKESTFMTPRKKCSIGISWLEWSRRPSISFQLKHYSC